MRSKCKKFVRINKRKQYYLYTIDIVYAETIWYICIAIDDLLLSFDYHTFIRIKEA